MPGRLLKYSRGAQNLFSNSEKTVQECLSEPMRGSSGGLYLPGMPKYTIQSNGPETYAVRQDYR